MGSCFLIIGKYVEWRIFFILLLEQKKRNKENLSAVCSLVGYIEDLEYIGDIVI